MANDTGLNGNFGIDWLKPSLHSTLYPYSNHRNHASSVRYLCNCCVKESFPRKVTSSSAFLKGIPFQILNLLLQSERLHNYFNFPHYKCIGSEDSIGRTEPKPEPSPRSRVLLTFSSDVWWVLRCFNSCPPFLKSQFKRRKRPIPSEARHYNLCRILHCFPGWPHAGYATPNTNPDAAERLPAKSEPGVARVLGAKRSGMPVLMTAPAANRSLRSFETFGEIIFASNGFSRSRLGTAHGSRARKQAAERSEACLRLKPLR